MSKTSDRSERRKQRLEIVYRTIDDMKPDPANARQHSKKQILKLANSIETFGFNVPVLVDAELNVIAGHGRLAACRALDLAEVDRKSTRLNSSHLTASRMPSSA